MSFFNDHNRKAYGDAWIRMTHLDNKWIGWCDPKRCCHRRLRWRDFEGWQFE
jgi:hypothetical protein